MGYFEELKKHISTANKSIRPASALILLYDILFYLFAFLGLYAFYIKFVNSLMLLQGSELFEFASNPSESSLNATYAVMQKFYLSMIGYSLLLIIFLLVIWSLSRYLIWLNITKKKFNIKTFLKFIPANTLWVMIISIPLVIMFIPFYNYVQIYGQSTQLPTGLDILRYILLSTILILFYFTNMMHLAFIRKEKIFSPLWKGFKVGVLNAFPSFVIYLALLVLLYIVDFLIQFLNIGTVGKVLSFLLLLLSFSWIKIFYNSSMKKLD